jgi:hypothetical protein
MRLRVRTFFAVAGIACALVGLLIFVGQIIAWLRIAEWRPFSVAALLYGLGIPEPHPVVSWVGLQKIIDSTTAALLDLPASLVLVGISGALFAVSECPSGDFLIPWNHLDSMDAFLIFDSRGLQCGRTRTGRSTTAIT